MIDLDLTSQYKSLALQNTWISFEFGLVHNVWPLIVRRAVDLNIDLKRRRFHADRYSKLRRIWRQNHLKPRLFADNPVVLDLLIHQFGTVSCVRNAILVKCHSEWAQSYVRWRCTDQNLIQHRRLRGYQLMVWRSDRPITEVGHAVHKEFGRKNCRVYIKGSCEGSQLQVVLLKEVGSSVDEV